MRKAGKISILAALALAMMASVPAFARGGHHHHHRSSVSLGFVFGAPAYWYHPYPAYAYYPPAYHYPPVAYSPPVYVERGDAYTPPEQSQGSQGYWYFCPEAKAYYPYVRQCAGGWQRVSPTPQQ